MPLKIICLVRVPFVCSMEKLDKLLKIHVQFDVIYRNLSCLIGRFSLLEKRVSLELQFTDISVIIHSDFTALSP